MKRVLCVIFWSFLMTSCALEELEAVSFEAANSALSELEGSWRANAPEGLYIITFEDETVQLQVENQTFEAASVEVIEVGDQWTRLRIHHSDRDVVTVVSFKDEGITFGWLGDWIFSQ